ncbi:MAG: pectate lyase [Prevotella sp.]|nr:pectate lyase [Prevotella sp.]
MAQEEIPAFPGAEGHGRYITGGRGGEIRHVTNLNDSGAGSLREALKGNNAKTIVFDVSGYIDLKSQLDITSNTTIAGQTAPYPGITLRYYTIYFGKCDNVIVRFLRFRRSQVKDVNDGADATWGRRRNQIMLDHCSFSWSIDEVASFYDNNNFTMQWCTVGEAQNDAGHGKGNHSYGGIWGGKLASFHHNLLIHLNNRVPRFNGARYGWGDYTKNMYYDQYKWENTIQAETVDLRNCVMYNWGNGNGCYGGPGGGYINIVNNYYKSGPGTKNTKTVTQVSVGASGNSTEGDQIGMTSRYYISGNYVTAAGDKAANYDWKGVTIDAGTFTIDGEKYSKDPKHFYGDTVIYKQNANGEDCIRIKVDGPCPIGDITTHSAETTYEKVLSYAGASIYRDAVDARFMEETQAGVVTYTGTKTGIKGIVDIINDPDGVQDPACPSFPDLASESRSEDFDTDGDGMPDEWESANGLNPNDAADGNAYTLDTEKGWYTNVEVYMNSIVEDIMKAGNADAESTIEEYYPASSKTGIIPLKPVSGILSTEYYSLEGFRLDTPRKGVTIRVERMTDGSKTVTKVYK